MKRTIGIILTLSILSCNSNKTQDNLITKVNEHDTLTIETYISDCGEWGGHKEFFHIYKKENNLWANIVCTWQDCDNDSLKKTGNRIDLTQGISSSDKEALITYINYIVKHNGTDKPYDNSTNIYIVHFKDSTYEVSTGDKLLEYQNMTDKVCK